MCLNVLNVCPDCQIQILANVPGKPFLFKTEIVTSSLLYRFSEFFRAGYIINVLRHFFCFLTHSFLIMVNKQHKNRFLIARIIFEKKKLLYFFVLVVKQPIPTILKNRALSHQIIMFIHVVCVLIGPVIYSHQNLFVNNDCGFLIFFLYLIVSIKRIEKTKNRVKSDLEITIKAIDSKHVEILSAIESADSKRKKNGACCSAYWGKKPGIPTSRCETKTVAGYLVFP